MELGYGSFVEMEWPYFFFLFIIYLIIDLIVNDGIIIFHIVCTAQSAYFFVLRLVTLPQPGLG